MLSEEFTRLMLECVLGEAPRDVMHLSEMERSAVCEIGNIMCCAYINALSDMMNVKVNVSVPDMCSDMAGALLSVPMIRFAALSDELLFIENRFRWGRIPSSATCSSCRTSNSVRYILKSLGVEDGR